jgi:DNA-binding NtrC family response regulator
LIPDDTLSSQSAAPRSTPSLVHRLIELFPRTEQRVLRCGTSALGRIPGAGQIAFPDDRSMSRFHARVRVEADQVEIEDANSLNGVYCNGVRVQRVRLADGDVVRIGDTFLLYRAEAACTDSDAAMAGLIGPSSAMRSVRADLARFARTKRTIVLLGETGTGKTAAATAIHALSGRVGLFVHVNAAAIPEPIAESLLFGHTAGAFTDARGAQSGWLRAAHNGTLFLDEVALLSPSTQARLLVALESGMVTPVGGTTPIPVDLRVVVATNADLSSATASGTFRPDLYGRLADVVVTMPPLRARREDILPLFYAALGGAGQLGGAVALDPELVALLLGWHWPYNVRELEKLATELRMRAEGAAVLGPSLVQGRLGVGQPVYAAPVDAPPSAESSSEATPEAAPAKSASRAASKPERPDRDALIARLKEADGNVSEVARLSGRSTKQIYRWCAAWGLDPAQFRGGGP